MLTEHVIDDREVLGSNMTFWFIPTFWADQLDNNCSRRLIPSLLWNLISKYYIVRQLERL